MNEAHKQSRFVNRLKRLVRLQERTSAEEASLAKRRRELQDRITSTRGLISTNTNAALDAELNSRLSDLEAAEKSMAGQAKSFTGLFSKQRKNRADELRRIIPRELQPV